MATRVIVWLKRAWRCFADSRLLRALQDRFRRSRVLQSAAGTLLAVTIAGIVSPSGLIRSSVSGITDILQPDPSPAQRSVDKVFANVSKSSFWRSTPRLSMGSNEALVSSWDDFTPDTFHPYSARKARDTSLSNLFKDDFLVGKQVHLRAYVTQVFRVSPVPGHGDQVHASFRLGLGDQSEVAWCNSMIVLRKETPVVDQLVDVVGMIVARGSANTASGGFVNGTYLVCSGFDPQVSAPIAEEVAALFREEEADSLWADPPNLSSEARMYLLRHWEQLTPYRLHRFPRHYVKPIRLDHLFEDTRFDGGEVNISGFVTQRHLSSAGSGRTFQQIRIYMAGQDSEVWCKTTIQNSRVVHEGSFVEAVGVPIARGISGRTGGGFELQTVMVCPALHSWRY